MKLIDRLERKISWIGIPGLLSIVAGLQLLVFVISLIRGPAVAEDYLALLSLDPMKVLDGEVWRVFSYVFVPKSESILFVIFGALVLHVTGQYLEQEMGSFRLTLFFISTVLLISLGVVIQSRFTHDVLWEVRRLMGAPDTFFMAPVILYSLLGMLLGLMCPRIVWRLYFLIPVSSAILGWIAFAGLLWAAFALPSVRLAVVLGSVPFWVIALPRLFEWYYLKQRVWKNRPAFEAAKEQFSEYFSKCRDCGRTDANHPQLTFRVAADGEEYCEDHLPKSP